MKGIVLSLLSITVKVTHQLRFIQVFLLFSFFLKPKTIKRQLIQIWLNHSFISWVQSATFLTRKSWPKELKFQRFFFSLSFFFLFFFLVFTKTRYLELFVAHLFYNSFFNVMEAPWPNFFRIDQRRVSTGPNQQKFLGWLLRTFWICYALEKLLLDCK